MDPISLTCAALTLGGFVKNVISVSLQLRNAIPQAESRLMELVDDIHNALLDLESFCEVRELALAGPPDLLRALESLQDEIRSVQLRCERMKFRRETGTLNNVKAKIKAWGKASDIEADLVRLRERINAHHLKFIAFSSARVEGSSYRIEGRLLVDSAHQRVRSNQLESLITQVLLDSKYGQHTMKRIEQDISHDKAHLSVESQFLLLQVQGLLDRMPDALSMLQESSLKFRTEPQTSVIPGRRPPVPRGEVLTRVLLFLRRIDQGQTGEWSGDPLDDLALILSGLRKGKFQGAVLNVHVWMTKILHQLIGRNPQDFTPTLVMELANITLFYTQLGNYDQAIAFGRVAVATARHFATTHPIVETRALMALSIRLLAHATWDGSDTEDDGLGLANESLTIYHVLISEMQDGVVSRREDVETVLSACRVLILRIEILAKKGYHHACHQAMVEYWISLLRLPTKEMRFGFNNVDARLVIQTLGYTTSGIYHGQATPLSLVERSLLLLSELATNHPTPFSKLFHLFLLGFSYLCEIGDHELLFTITMAEKTVLEAIFAPAAKIRMSEQPFNRMIQYLRLKGVYSSVVKAAIRSYIYMEEAFPPHVALNTHFFFKTLAITDESVATEEIMIALAADSSSFYKPTAMGVYSMMLPLVNKSAPRTADTILPLAAQIIQSRVFEPDHELLGLYFKVSALLSSSLYDEARDILQELVAKLQQHPFAAKFGAASLLIPVLPLRTFEALGRLDQALETSLVMVQMLRDILAASSDRTTVGREYFRLLIRVFRCLKTRLHAADARVIAKKALRWRVNDSIRDIEGLMELLVGVGHYTQAVCLSLTPWYEQKRSRSSSRMSLALCHRSQALLALGRNEEARRAAQDAMDIRLRKRFSSLDPSPESRNPRRALVCATLANCHSKLGDWEKALTAGEEAIRIYRVAVARCTSSTSELCKALMDHSKVLEKLGRLDDAIALSGEAATLGRSWYTACPWYCLNLADLLGTLGTQLLVVGRLDESNRVFLESLSLRQSWPAIHAADRNGKVRTTLKVLEQAMGRLSQSLNEHNGFKSRAVPTTPAVANLQSALPQTVLPQEQGSPQADSTSSPSTKPDSEGGSKSITNGALQPAETSEEVKAEGTCPQESLANVKETTPTIEETKGGADSQESPGISRALANDSRVGQESARSRSSPPSVSEAMIKVAVEVQNPPTLVPAPPRKATITFSRLIAMAANVVILLWGLSQGYDVVRKYLQDGRVLYGYNKLH